MPEPSSDEFHIPLLEPGETPVHGYRGEPSHTAVGVPAGLSIAITREAGSRGATVAQRAGEKLGWEVYTQDMLEYGSQNAALRQELSDKLSSSAKTWIDERLNELLHQATLSRHPNIIELARLALMLAAQGNVVLLGRGAGFILPVSSTLHVRLIAPLPDRVAYMSQWLRLTEEEAAQQVHQRDQRRTEFLATHFHRKPNDVHLYDMVLNTSLLGEERCADVIATAAKAKMSAVVGVD
jgi:cytidylate kinase